MITARWSVPDIEGWAERTFERALRATERLAATATDDLTQKLRDGLRGDGTPLPRLRPSTLQRKRPGGSPWIDTGHLADPTQWRRVEIRDGQRIVPPFDRRIPAMRASLVSVSRELVDAAEREVEQVAADARADWERG